MAWKQVREILDAVRGFHSQLGDYYEAVRKQTGDERLRMLLEYMKRHEKRFNTALSKYEDGAAASVLDTWLQYAPVEQLAEEIATTRITPEMSVDEVFEIAMRVDAALLGLYRQLMEGTAAPAVRELFMNLLQMEESKDQQYARSMQEFE